VDFPVLDEGGITLETLRNSYCGNPMSFFDLEVLFDLKDSI
jgi:hypothetical protein